MTTLARYAEPFLRPMAFAWLAIGAASRRGLTSGPVKPTETPQKPAGEGPTSLPLEDVLHRRAMRIRNREPRAIAQYMAVHQNLSRGR